MLRKISTWFDEQKRQADYASATNHAYQHHNPVHRMCNHANCRYEGLYKAPKMDGTSHHQDDQSWMWFCEAHVREYNASWNYYKGMNEEQAYASYRGDVTWNRPTWPMGKWSNHHNPHHHYLYQGGHQFHDPFEMFQQGNAQGVPNARISKQDHEAMRLMGLSHPFTKEQLQFTYRQMVKRYHPDLNSGDQKAEETFKKITEGYQNLKKYVSL